MLRRIVYVPRVVADGVGVQVFFVAQLYEPFEQHALRHLVPRHRAHKAALDPLRVGHAVALGAASALGRFVYDGLRQPVHAPLVNPVIAGSHAEDARGGEVDAVCRVEAGYSVAEAHVGELVSLGVRDVLPRQPCRGSVLLHVEVLHHDGGAVLGVVLRLFHVLKKEALLLDGAKPGVRLNPACRVFPLFGAVQFVEPCEEAVIGDKAVEPFARVVVLRVED